MGSAGSLICCCKTVSGYFAPLPFSGHRIGYLRTCFLIVEIRKSAECILRRNYFGGILLPFRRPCVFQSSGANSRSLRTCARVTFVLPNLASLQLPPQPRA